MKPYEFKRPPRPSVSHLLADGLLMALSLFAALYLRLNDARFFDFVPNTFLFLPVLLGVRWICLWLFGCYRVIWRYVSINDGLQLAKAIGLSTLILTTLSFLTNNSAYVIPRSVFIIDAGLALLVLSGARLARRILHEKRSTRGLRGEGRRTLIYGAGNNGRMMANRFRSDGALRTHLVGYIDDDVRKQKNSIAGIPVLGTRKSLGEIIAKEAITQVVIAIPGLPGPVLRDIVLSTRPFNIQPQIMTSLASGGKKSVETYREIQVSDLLNRQPREIDLQSVQEMIKNRRVLVTGAGGSIGAELSRQIMAHSPSRLLLLDHSEYNLYAIDGELRLSTNDTERVVPLLVDIKDDASLKTALREYAPEVVFHAAAYKHVHLVESNPYSSILNNVMGTLNLLNVCEEVGVETFLMVSTDKAVNPAGIMGATKRVCELLVTAAALRLGKSYSSTRFGNVLGSSGSLIPLLQKQINEGGPVTVTHEDMTRFFMLIPEAVSLVLKAATIAQPGDINVLKMGEPVKIVDVARSLIALNGRTEDEISIMFTGLRPGEKMFEELYIRGDELTTEHPDILTLPNGDSNLARGSESLTKLQEQVTRMIAAARTGSKEALFEINDLVKSKYLKAGAVPADKLQ